MAEPREPLARFAAACEDVLRENDSKGGWDGSERDWLLERLQGEVRELSEALDVTDYSYDEAAIRKECCDVANFW